MEISAFIAGVLMFLAPCTLPLLPAYLAFISGSHVVPGEQLSTTCRRRLRVNALFYILGFSLVFISFGVIAGLGGRALLAYRPILMKVGGALIMFFGLFMLGIFKGKLFQFLESQKKLSLTSHLTPGKPLSAFILGVTLALGWTPCVGPVLGTILLLASTSTTVWQGAWLLFIFSLGLGIPFYITAIAYEKLATFLHRLNRYARTIEVIGGLILFTIGLLMVTGYFAIWESFFYDLFSIAGFDALLNFL